MRALALAVALGALACTGLPATDDPREPSCGDGWVGGDEECDDGEANGDSGTCTPECRIARCGDGHVGPGETCDDAIDERCDGCRSPDDSEWHAIVDGVEAIAAAGATLYVAGELVAEDAVLLRLDGRTGVIEASAAWVDFEGATRSWRGDVRVAARDQGGAVVGAGIAYDGAELRAVVAFFAESGELEGRYVSAPLDDEDRGVDAIAVGADDAAVVAGPWNEDAWVGEVAGAVEGWSYRYSSGSSSLLATAVDVDASGRILAAGNRFGELFGWVAYVTPAGTRVWDETPSTTGILDVRVESSSTFRLVRGDGERVLVDARDLATGGIDDTVQLSLPLGTEVSGARLLPDGRLLSFGRGSRGSWLALHEADGAIVWRANPTELRAEIVGADLADDWVYANVAGVAVAGWDVSATSP